MVDRLANSGINSQRIAHIETCFGTSGQLLRETGRVLVGEGVLTKLCRKKPKLRQFFLFNDILVYGNIVISKKKYNKQNILPLKHIKIEEIPDNDTIVSPDYGNDGEQLRNGWLIISPTKSFAVYAQTPQEKKEWMSHMKRGIEEQRIKAGITAESTDLAPTWVPDTDAEHCMRCRKTKFTTLNRRHHCRKCGLVVCNTCSTQRAVIPYQSSKPIRVCDACFEAILKNPNSLERASLKKGGPIFVKPSQNNQPSSSNGASTQDGSLEQEAPSGGMKTYVNVESSDSDSDAPPSTNTAM